MSNKLKILIISNNYPPYFDGISVYTQNLYNQLIYIGNEVKLVNFDNQFSYKNLRLRDLFYTQATKNPYYSLTNILNPFTLLNNNKGFRNYIFTNMVSRVCSKEIQEFKPDIIHLTYPRIFSAVKTTTKPVVLSTYSEEIKDIYPVKEYIKLASKIVCISTFTAKIILSLDQSAKNKIEIIPCSIDINQYINESAKKDKRENIIISVGRLSKEKNFDTTINAFANLPKRIRDNYIYLIVGNGIEKEKLQKQILELKLIKSIKLIGNISEKDKISLLKQSKYFLLCPRIKKNEQEGFGIAFLEAQAAGLAILTSQIGGIKEAVGNAGLYIKNPEDPILIAEALEKLISDEKLVTKLTKEGVTRVRQFDHKIWINKIENIYKELKFSKH